MISEYEIGRFGWLMRLAFFCWGASVLSLLITIWPYLLPISGTISRWWFVLIVIALFGAGIFKTNPITDRTPNPVNTIHTLCGAIVILTFPIVATLAVHSLLHNPLWLANQGLLIFGTILIWIGMVVFFGSIIIARIKNPSAGEAGGPHVYQGWRCRRVRLPKSRPTQRPAISPRQRSWPSGFATRPADVSGSFQNSVSNGMLLERRQ